MIRNTDDDLHYNLSGIRVRLRGIPGGCRQTLEACWAEFADAPSDAPLLNVQVRVAGIPVESGRSLAVDQMESSFDGEVARFRMPEGELEVGTDGEATILLAPGPDRKQFYTLLNLLLPALAWSLPSKGAAVLHAAGIVLDGSAFVLVGPAGAGKSTWANIAHAAGALFLSDDVVFVDASAERVQVLSLPFRAEHPRPIGPGRWALSALLFAAHGESPRLDPIDKMLARGRLVANLPYVAGSLQTDPRISKLIDLIVGKVPLKTLTFAEEPSFLELLRQFAKRGA